MLAPLAYGVGVDLGGARGLRQRLQRRRDIAFEIGVGVQVLIDHMAFELIVVDRDNLAFGRLGVRRIPGRPAADEEDEIGIFEMLISGDAEIERMIGRKIGEIRHAAPHHRNRQQIGEFDQRLERFGIAARLLGDDDRIFRFQKQVGDLRYFAGMCFDTRRKRHVAVVRRR